jgi:dTDP-4-amino-4,6-dideoxygalactose transaminase
VPFANAPGEATPHIMPVLLPAGVDRTAVMAGMKSAGIQTSIHYRPIDTFTAYREAGFGPSSRLPRTHDIGARVITLPLFPSMDDDTVRLVCDALFDAVDGAR